MATIEVVLSVGYMADTRREKQAPMKKNVACHISKQRMLQLSNPASPEGTQEGEEQGPDPDS